MEQEDQVSALVRLQSWHKGLALELEILYNVLSKSSAQHGHAKYHRRTKQIHALLTNRYCVLNIVPVAEQVSERFDMLAKQLKGRTKERKKILDTKISKLSDIEENSLHPSRRSSVSSALTNVSNKSQDETYEEADPMQEMAPKNVSRSSSNVGAMKYSERLSFLPSPTTGSSLCDGLEWLYQIHKKGILHWNGSIASRIHGMTHLHCMEMARGYFLPQLTVMFAAMARIKYIIHHIGKTIVLFLLELKEANHYRPIFEFLEQSSIDDTRQLSNEKDDGHSWLGDNNKYVTAQESCPFQALKIKFSIVFDDLSVVKDLAPYQPKSQTESKKSKVSSSETKRSTASSEINLSTDTENKSENNVDDRAVAVNEAVKQFPTPTDSKITSSIKGVQNEDLGESFLDQAKEDVLDMEGQSDAPEDKNAMLLATFSAMQEKEKRKKKKHEREENNERKSKRKRQKQNVDAPKTALDEIFDSPVGKKEKKTKAKKKSKEKSKSKSNSRHALDDIFDGL